MPGLNARRVAAFLVVAAAVVAWFIVAPHLGHLRLWPTILLVSIVVLPGTLLLVLIALPLWRERWIFPAAVVLALVAFGCAQAGWGPPDFAKLWARSSRAGRSSGSSRALRSCCRARDPLVDIISGVRWPTKTITSITSTSTRQSRSRSSSRRRRRVFGPPTSSLRALPRGRAAIRLASCGRGSR